MEYYKKYRPKTLEAVIGQDGAMASLKKLISRSIPHAILLTGPSGCGKTTVARILQGVLECGDADFHELNSADTRGIDDVRGIRNRMGFAPIDGKCKIWLIDEAHKMTNDAQNAILKMLEDTPSHIYFMLATTDPQKIIKTIHTRCTEIKLLPLKADQLEKVIKRVVDKERMDVTDEVVDEIIGASDGSARKALVILEQVGRLDTEEEQLEAIQTTTLVKDQAIELARALFKPASWGDVAKILKSLSEQDPEGIRYLVLSYSRTILLGDNRKTADRAFKVIECFGRNFYDSKNAGLAAACWRAYYL